MPLLTLSHLFGCGPSLVLRLTNSTSLGLESEFPSHIWTSLPGCEPMHLPRMSFQTVRPHSYHINRRKMCCIFKSNIAICLKRQVYNSCVLPAMIYGAETWTLTKQAQNKLAATQTKMERSMLNITYKDRRTNIWVRKRTKLIDIIYTVRIMKWSWAWHINRLKDDRWTSRVTAWRPHDKKRRQWRPAKRRRDDLDKYWSDTIWQRTAQDRVILRRHAEAFAQPRDTTAA